MLFNISSNYKTREEVKQQQTIFYSPPLSLSSIVSRLAASFCSFSITSRRALSHKASIAMATSAQKVDWSRIVQQMAADKKRLEAAIRGDKQALHESTFLHPHAVPAH